MTSEQTGASTVDDFDAAWRTAIEAARPALELWSALVRLTGWAEHPADLDRLAAELGRSVPATEALIRQYGGRAVRVESGLVHHVHPAAPGPSTRWRIHLGDRTLYSDTGCAPDLFAMVLWSGRAVTVDTVCPATGVPIRVHLTPDGSARGEPATAAVSILDYRQPRVAGVERLPADDRDEVVCAQQSFFSSTDAADGWLLANPGGRLVPVTEFFDWIRRVGLH